MTTRENDTPSMVQRWYVLIVMMLVYTLSIADRYVVSTVLDAMKADLNLTDQGVAMLSSWPLALFYVVLGFPVSYILDRHNRTKIVAVTQVSNALGTVVPVKQIIDMAHRAGALALVDGAQSVSHMRVDVRALDADFFIFSGHKIFGPTGIGAVYGKREVLEDMPPWQGGGNMIKDVTFEKTEYHAAPGRFEAGTGNIADAVGLGAALEYVEKLGIENIAAYEHSLLTYGMQKLGDIPGLRLIGTADHKASPASRSVCTLDCATCVGSSLSRARC